LGRWSRASNPLLRVSPDSSFAVEDVVPLGMYVDTQGHLWLERPRSVRAAAGEWDILGRNAEPLGAARTPAGCGVRFVGYSRVLCKFRTDTNRTLPRFVSFPIVDGY
jgi:hypothetical protein